MYRALQIANYIIKIALDKGEVVTNLHLQKILYYLQVNELVTVGTPLFRDDMEKWRLGPVVPNVYHEYKGSGSQPISDIEKEIVFDDETMEVKFIEFNENHIELSDREKTNPLITKLLNENAFTLVDKTHEHEPWKSVEPRIYNGEKELKYTHEELIDYFTLYPDKLQEVIGG